MLPPWYPNTFTNRAQPWSALYMKGSCVKPVPSRSYPNFPGLSPTYLGPCSLRWCFYFKKSPIKLLIYFSMFMYDCVVHFIYYKMTSQKEPKSVMGETTAGSANCKDDSACLEAIYTWISPIFTRDSGSQGSLWAALCSLKSGIVI